MMEIHCTDIIAPWKDEIGDREIFWQYIPIRVYSDNLVTDCTDCKFSNQTWDINMTAIYYLRSDNVLRIPCWNSWQYTKYRELCTTPVMMYCYDVILKFQKCMKQLPVKDLACLSYSRRIHEGARFIQSVQANLHMNYFLENTCESWQDKRYSVLY